MNVFLIILSCLFFCVIGYLLGNILFGPIIAKAYNRDVRKEGSNNPGATNVWRTLSKKAGFIVSVLDCLKSYVAVIICWGFYFCTIKLISTEIYLYWTVYLGGVFAVIGHCLPIRYVYALIKKKENAKQFSGGKGVSSFGGLLFAISPWIALCAFGFWLVIVLITRYISLASIFMTIFASSMIFVPGVNWLYLFSNDLFDWYSNYLSNADSLINIICIFSMCICLSSFIIWRHKNNIKNLLDKKERKFF